MDKKDYLFIFTITPVQSFIAQARKTRDLYAGSRILSELTKQAIKCAKKDYNAKIIMPYIKENEDLDQIFSITNRFVAKFENIEEESLEKIGKDIEFKVFLHWKKKIATYIKNKFINNGNKDWEKKFYDQIMKYFSIYWTFYPIKENYQNSYKKAENLLGAIKNIRYFEQFETNENYRKCSICGERDAIVYTKRENREFPPFAYPKAKVSKNNFLIDTNEGLCGVCFIKRFFVSEAFPSTSKIALLNLYNNEITDKRILSYEKKYSVDGFFNEQLLFEENLNKTYLERHNLYILIPKLENMKKDLKDIIKTAKEVKEPYTKYYAFIKFDGDSMGKWLSGENLKNKEELENFHKELSLKLREYSKWAKSYIDGDEDKVPKGKTIYAGGDDFLGFINLKYLFKVLKTLRDKFDEKVNEPLSSYKKERKNLTFSAGIVIAHYKSPLSLVLEKVSQLEEKAKNQDGKDAFAIAVLKHSGEIKEAVYKWENLSNIAEIYKTVVEEETFSSSFITKLEEGFKKVPLKDLINAKGRKPFIYELKRTLKRSVNKKISKEKIEKLIKQMEKTIEPLLDPKYAEEIFEILNIIRFLERELN